MSSSARVGKQLRVFLLCLLDKKLVSEDNQGKAEKLIAEQLANMDYVQVRRSRQVAVAGERCVARIWATGNGRQCSKSRSGGGEFCTSHGKAHRRCCIPCSHDEDGKPIGLYYGRIDEEVPITSHSGDRIVHRWTGPPEVVQQIADLVKAGIPYRTKPTKKKKKAPITTASSVAKAAAPKPKPWFYFLKSRRPQIKAQLRRYSDEGWSFDQTLILLERECFDMESAVPLCTGEKCDDLTWASSGPKTMYRKVASRWWAYLKKECPGTIDEITMEAAASVIVEIIPSAAPLVIEERSTPVACDDDFVGKQMTSGGMALVTTNTQNMYEMKDLVIGRGWMHTDFCEDEDNVEDYGWNEIYGMPIGRWFAGTVIKFTPSKRAELEVSAKKNLTDGQAS